MANVQFKGAQVDEGAYAVSLASESCGANRCIIHVTGLGAVRLDKMGQAISVSGESHNKEKDNQGSHGSASFAIDSMNTATSRCSLI